MIDVILMPLIFKIFFTVTFQVIRFPYIKVQIKSNYKIIYRMVKIVESWVRTTVPEFE